MSCSDEDGICGESRKPIGIVGWWCSCPYGHKGLCSPENFPFSPEPEEEIDDAVQVPEAPKDGIVHPDHYNWLPGIECIKVVQHFNFNLGNCIKYVWRAGKKDSETTEKDLRKAIEYLQFELERVREFGPKA